MSLNEKLREVLKCLLGAHGRDFLPLHQAAQYVYYFNIEQLRRMKVLRSSKGALH
jgi:hypothetical protein